MMQNKDLCWNQSQRHRGKRTNTNRKFAGRLDEKIKKAEADFEAKTLEQSQKAEKEKVAIEDIRKKVLETLAETKKRKQQEGEVKRTT